MAKNSSKPSKDKGKGETANGKQSPDSLPKQTGDYVVGHCKPPVEHQFKPGNQLRKGKGRNVLATVKEYYNTMGEMSRPELESIANAPNVTHNKMLAALDMIEDMKRKPDMADFEGVVIANKTLQGLRDAGIDTTAIKSFKQTQGKDGVSTALTLHDRDHRTIDRVLDRTGGKAHQSVDVTAAVAVGVRIEVVGSVEMGSVKMVDSTVDGENGKEGL